MLDNLQKGYQLKTSEHKGVMSQNVAFELNSVL